MKKVKCTNKKWCPGLDGVIQRGYFSGKGISELRLINSKTAKKTNGGAVYREKAGAKGVMLNFCPWCGTDIAFFEKLEKKAS